MEFQKLKIPEVIKITPQKFADSRGYFMETFQHKKFTEFVGHEVTFVQENQSLSHSSATVRGLHFQRPPRVQGKLVRCSRGSIIDVAVDIRTDSVTYGRYVAAELTAQNGCQLWIPEGFLHGFATLEPDSEVQYKCTDYYAPDCEGSIIWNDPDLGIDWAIDSKDAVLSEKDNLAMGFQDFQSPFT